MGYHGRPLLRLYEAMTRCSQPAPEPRARPSILPQEGRAAPDGVPGAGGPTVAHKGVYSKPVTRPAGVTLGGCHQKHHAYSEGEPQSSGCDLPGTLTRNDWTDPERVS
jgi:hypothetical protein